MRFGLHYLPAYLPEMDGSVPEFYRRMIEQVVEAESLGFHDAWFTEHHFHEYGGTVSHPPVFLTALAGVTQRIRLGAAISVVPLHNPLQNAEAYAMVDVLSGGRLDLGIGRGANPEEFQEFGIGYEDSPLRLREHADVLLQAWSDDPVTFRGELYAYNNVRTLPKPLQRPHPPIWVAASRSDDTFRWAGEKGFNLLTLPYVYEPPVLQHWLGVYRDALAQQRFDPAGREILGKFHVFVDESDAAASRAAEPFWLNYQRLHYDRGSWTFQQPQVAADFRREVVAGHVIAGDPAHCIDLIERWRETFGLTALSGVFHFGGMPQATALRNIRLFAERVIPAFASAHATT